MVTTLMWNLKLLSFSGYHSRPVGGLNCVQLCSIVLWCDQLYPRPGGGPPSIPAPTIPVVLVSLVRHKGNVGTQRPQ